MATNSSVYETVLPEGAEIWRFRLFLLGSQPRSAGSLANIRRILEDHLGGNFSLEIIDLEKDPHSARDHQILMIPTLLRLSPEPPVRLVGTFHDSDRVVAALDLPLRNPGSVH